MSKQNDGGLDTICPKCKHSPCYAHGPYDNEQSAVEQEHDCLVRRVQALERRQEIPRRAAFVDRWMAQHCWSNEATRFTESDEFYTPYNEYLQTVVANAHEIFDAMQRHEAEQAEEKSDSNDYPRPDSDGAM